MTGKAAIRQRSHAQRLALVPAGLKFDHLELCNQKTVARECYANVAIRVFHTCQQQLVVHRDLTQFAQQLAVEVLQAVALINNDVLPCVSLQQLAVCYHYLIRRHNDWELLACWAYI